MTPNPVIDILGLSQVAVAGALYGPFSWHPRRPKGIRSLHLLKNELRMPFNYNSSNYLFVHGRPQARSQRVATGASAPPHEPWKSAPCEKKV